jgi:uncharacterized protein
MKRSTATLATDEWTIYNCHIHTFTQKHVPRNFFLWVLSDGELGRISVAKISFYLFLLMLSFGGFLLLAKLTISLSQRSDLWFLLGDSIAQFLQTLLAISIIFIIVLLMITNLMLLEWITDLFRRLRFMSPFTRTSMQFMELANEVSERRRAVISFGLLPELIVRLKRFHPGFNDFFERMLCFLKITQEMSQREVFQRVALAYPYTTVFVVLPMDMSFMDLGKPETPIERQHQELLELAQTYNGQIIPFYAADPRHADIVERVRENLAPGKFRGISLYPNLGYRPDDPTLMEVYRLCVKGNYPVITHCSMGGIWRYGLTKQERRANSGPLNYKRILDTEEYRGLKLCLANFGGLEEWVKHLKGNGRETEEGAWLQTIYAMIASEEYPNLYADISDMVFTPGIGGLTIELVDYLKVLLTHPRVRQRVLFGSDYYFVERKNMTEKEVSLLLRIQLGEDIYKQIAYTNPREYLGIEVPPPRVIRKGRRTPGPRDASKVAR